MSTGVVTTIGQKCKRCYSCVRECPAKAIKVIDGQAFVMEERCISCGYCVKVCSLDAKRVKNDIDLVLNELIPSGNAIAVIAPAFPASFPEHYSKIPTALRQLGFNIVAETAFGADLVSKYYTDIYDKEEERNIISTPCPAVVNLIQKYYVELVPNLAPVVSPMVAIGRYMKHKYGSNKKVVFIGPCVAKKDEYTDTEVSDAVDAVLTFKELKEIFWQNNIELELLQESQFDHPHGYLGKSYPLAGGLTRTASLSSDILEREVIIVEGKNRVLEIIGEISSGKLKSKFVDILFCEGCINGPAIDSELNYYSRREKVIDYIHDNINSYDKHAWKGEMYNSRNLNLSRTFMEKSQRRPMPSEEEIKRILARTEKFTKSDELNCGSCGYPSCREYAIAIAKDLAEDDMCLPFLIEKLEYAYRELKDTQEQLHNAEKLASIGQLAAGVAHEINNPLGSIILYASMLKRQFKDTLNEKQNVDDLKLIVEEANRCKNIVSNLLNFARQGKLRLSTINVYEIIEIIIKSMMINPIFSNVKYTLDGSAEHCFIEGDSDQLKQVFLNLIINASEALEQSSIKEVNITINKVQNTLIIKLSDTGCGISNENIGQIFTPFFTTKKIGKGTGLGLAIAYGIVKMHRGEINVKSEINKGTTFTIHLPHSTVSSQQVLMN
ncbi:MAG: 4Fe-4S binding protein [Melioribacteraceae bacterium]|jgi:signal transduction histidine kinase/iron only hydrogenase large subunit-like protein|nr:4Fe-4S binding protein [Melioribacteraceae bacterium]